MEHRCQACSEIKCGQVAVATGNTACGAEHHREANRGQGNSVAGSIVMGAEAENTVEGFCAWGGGNAEQQC